MHFLREIGVFILSAAIVFVLWDLVVLAALRVFKIPVAIGFGKKRWSENNSALRRLGKPMFVFIRGILLWGWPVGVLIEIFDYTTGRYQADGTLSMTAKLILALLIWSAAGVWFGWTMWNKSATPYDIDHPAN